MRLTESKQRETVNKTDDIYEMSRGALIRRETGNPGEVVNGCPRPSIRMRGTAS